MKIFSNFDTKLRAKKYAEYIQQYGEGKVTCFGRSRLYGIVKVELPLLLLALVTIFGLIFFYKRLGGDYFGYIIVAILIIDFVFFFPVIGKFIDYKMDFIIVIPNCMIMFDQ